MATKKHSEKTEPKRAEARENNEIAKRARFAAGELGRRHIHALHLPRRRARHRGPGSVLARDDPLGLQHLQSHLFHTPHEVEEHPGVALHGPLGRRGARHGLGAPALLGAREHPVPEQELVKRGGHAQYPTA